MNNIGFNGLNYWPPDNYYSENYKPSVRVYEHKGSTGLTGQKSKPTSMRVLEAYSDYAGIGKTWVLPEEDYYSAYKAWRDAGNTGKVDYETLKKLGDGKAFGDKRFWINQGNAALHGYFATKYSQEVRPQVQNTVKTSTPPKTTLPQIESPNAINLVGPIAAPTPNIPGYTTSAATEPPKPASTTSNTPAKPQGGGQRQQPTAPKPASQQSAPAAQSALPVPEKIRYVKIDSDIYGDPQYGNDYRSVLGKIDAKQIYDRANWKTRDAINDYKGDNVGSIPKERLEPRRFEGPTPTDAGLGITDPYMFLNALSAGIGVARGAESLIRESMREQPSDIIAPKLAVPKFESPSDVMRSSGQRFNERSLNTAMRYMREQGATPSDLTGVIAQTLEADRQVAEQALAADIEARNQNSQVEATISGQQAQLDWQADLATQERNLKLAEASERAIAEGWQSMTSSITGLAQSAYNRNMSEQANAYNMYSTLSKKLELVREKKSSAPASQLALYIAQERELEKQMEAYSKVMTELEKKPMLAQMTGVGPKNK